MNLYPTTSPNSLSSKSILVSGKWKKPAIGLTVLLPSLRTLPDEDVSFLAVNRNVLWLYKIELVILSSRSLKGESVTKAISFKRLLIYKTSSSFSDVNLYPSFNMRFFFFYKSAATKLSVSAILYVSVKSYSLAPEK